MVCLTDLQFYTAPACICNSVVVMQIGTFNYNLNLQCISVLLLLVRYNLALKVDIREFQERPQTLKRSLP